MKQFNIIDFHEEWEQLTTQELEALLQTELGQEQPDDETVLTLLHILESREPDLPLQLSKREAEAWAWYRGKRSGRKPKSFHAGRWLSVAASVALVAGLLMTVVPQKAEAETFWEMLQRMTSSVIMYFSGEGRKATSEYTFTTDNPGLQQVYDAVVELGVTDPVVPMWLPENSELVELTSKQTPMAKNLVAVFFNGEADAIYKMDVYDGEPAHQYYKDDSHYESYEIGGTTFNITRNSERWVVVWSKDSIECSIFIDCQEETLRRILKSIFVMEE